MKNKLTYALYAALFVMLSFSAGCLKPWFAHRRAIEHYVTAMSLQSVDFNDDAVLELQEAVKLDSDFALAHSMIGDIYLKQGKYPQAAGAYEQACQLDPWAFSDHFHLGQVYQVLKRFQDAVKVFKRACLLKPDDTQANYQLGVCYYEINDFDNAAKYCGKAAELEPANADIFASLGKIHGKSGDDYKAINFYKQALEINANQPDVMVSLGMVYVRMKRFGPGQLILEKAVALAPDNADTHIALGYCLLCEEDPTKALDQYKQAIGLNADNREALNGIGVAGMILYFNQQQQDKKLAQSSLESWHRSLELEPDQPKIKRLVEKYTKLIFTPDKQPIIP
jgi:tetratricopeptide (TPR) repeat protein